MSTISISAPADKSVVSYAYMRVQPELFEVLKTQQLRDGILYEVMVYLYFEDISVYPVMKS